ncbi:MAG: alpha/beta fold hydrolase [Bacteroidota bacterium]|jgi:pimeloyl-ACP methyl ester carboxylesterase|nr:alpha/beta fold hydrolase [Bacteroidota bacterium]
MIPAFSTDDGSGPPLLLLHAFPLNAAMWQPLRRDLARRWRVISLTLPGFGRGGPFLPGTTIDDCADMACALLDTMNIDRAAVAGCSMGGYITLAMFRRHPERVAAMILANTRAGADAAEAAANRSAQARAVREGGLAAFLAGMRDKLVGPTTQATAPDVLQLIDEMMASATVEGTAGMLDAMRQRPDSTATLAAATVPVCLIAGAEDVLIPPAEAEAMQALLPAAELHILPTSGHLSCLERPMLFNNIVDTFLARRVWPARS